mmetsp:Transcript_32123/g.94563  ORF Transcript_32123/g.94563 Transcript_32123/m.94563 type:complete len:240 (-) Transcript_32123:880-1599(-)
MSPRSYAATGPPGARPMTAAAYNSSSRSSSTGATRRPVTASESSGTSSRPTLIGRPSLVSAAERARILQSQRAAALRRRNVQLRIAKIEAEPVAEWQSSSKSLTLHHADSVTKTVEPARSQQRHNPVPPINDDESSIEESPPSVLPSKSESNKKRIVATKPAIPTSTRTSSPSPPTPIQSHLSPSEYSSSSSSEELNDESSSPESSSIKFLCIERAPRLPKLALLFRSAALGGKLSNCN